LTGIDVHAARDDLVVLAIDEIDVALVVAKTDIAGGEPSVPKGGSGLFGAVEVAVEEVGRGAEELTDLPVRRLVPFVREESHQRADERQPDGAGLAQLIGRSNHRDSPALGGPVRLEQEPLAEMADDALLEVLRERRRVRDERAQRMSAVPLELRVRELEYA